MAEIDRPQPFEAHKLRYEPQPELMKHILEWSKSLPQSPGGILDLAAGYGIEVQELLRLGINCTAQDDSEAMIQHALVKVIRGTAEDLSQHPDNFFSGALLKDTWVFLSPLQRQQMFSGLNQTLVSGGSLFIQSQKQTKFYLEYSLNHNEKMSLSAGSYQDFLTIAAMVRRFTEPDLLLYQSTPNETELLAKEFGFSFQLLSEYNINHPLAKESRWCDDPPEPGFIAVLTKKD